MRLSSADRQRTAQQRSRSIPPATFISPARPDHPQLGDPRQHDQQTFAAKLTSDGSKFLYVTYLPSALATASSIADDSQGNAYIAGQTVDKHACVVKVSADGSTFAYVTELAASKQESANSIAVDAAGDAFVARLDPNGNLIASTFLGGSDRDSATSIVIDANDNVFVGGAAGSLDFPTTPGSFQPAALVLAWSITPGSFVAELSSDESSLRYATYAWTGRGPSSHSARRATCTLAAFRSPVSQSRIRRRSPASPAALTRSAA